MTALLHRLVFCLVLALPLSAKADPIQNVISDQIAAFLADDFDRAYAHASPSIKRLFQTPERFGQMVREGYPMVYRPEAVTMLEQQEIGPHTIQRVMLRDAAGRLHFLAYAMVEGPEGWQINGVQILRGPDAGV